MSGESTKSERWHTVRSSVLLAVLTPMALFALARIFHIEDNNAVMLAETFTPYLLLPAYVVLLFATLTRRWVITGVAVFLVICHLVWVFPEYRPARSLPDEIAAKPTFTLFSQNLMYDNPTPDAVVESIRRENADVLLFQELTYRTENLLKDSGALDAYPYEITRPDNGARGLGTWSKYPFNSADVIDEIKTEVEMPSIRTSVTIHGQPVVVWNVHTKSPPLDGAPVADWRDDLKEMGKQLHAETGNAVAAGDFNAVWSHRPYREIVSHGWRDVHIDRGRGYARTWPNGANSQFRRIGGLIRIDHVLTRGSLRATSIKGLPSLGSDHKGTLTKIAVL